MAGWNGSGVFTRNYNWVVDRDAGIKILASKMDTEHDTFVAGIQACIAKNGENSATANLGMGGFKHVNTAASSNRADYARVAEMVDNTHTAVDAGGTANAQTLTLSPAITTYTKYQRFSFIPVADNAAGAATLNVSGLGVKSIKTIDGSNLAQADLDASGIAEVMYDGTNFVLLNPAGINQVGTWIPNLFGATTAGTWTYTTQQGRYVRNGKFLQLTAALVITSIGTAAGDLRIDGLPFVANFNNPLPMGPAKITSVNLNANHFQTNVSQYDADNLSIISTGEQTGQVIIDVSSLLQGGASSLISFTIMLEMP